MRSAFLLFCTVFSLIGHRLDAFDLTKLNLNYQYDPHDEIRLNHRVVESVEGLSVLYELHSDPGVSLNLTLLLQTNYSSVTHDTLKVFDLDTIVYEDRRIFRLTFEPQAKKSVLIISIGHSSLGVYWLFDVEIGSPVGYPMFYPVDESGLPILTSFVTSGEVSFSRDSVFHVYEYSEEFGAADPPMGQMKPISPTLKVDTAFFFGRNLQLSMDYSFSLIQKDSTDPNGITLLRTPVYFPKLRRMEELIGPLTYITTENELSALKQGPNAKEVFEKFWINTYGTQLRAKGAIRQFYEWVEEANLLFTDYKPGWQTDRGMIYVIFGKPENVRRTDSNEIWQYGTTEFEFIRIPSLFTPSLYTLKRDIKYDKIWYARVGAIRKG